MVNQPEYNLHFLGWKQFLDDDIVPQEINCNVIRQGREESKSGEKRT